MAPFPQGRARSWKLYLYRGALPRGDVPALLDMGERHARRVVAALLEKGVLRSESSRAPLLLAFPASTAGRWMPDLFPDHIES